MRPKFDRYISISNRQEFIRLPGRVAEMVPITYTIRACRDPKDDKILEVAVNGSANLIITGDSDLLALHPFQDIAIVSPSSYLRTWRRT